MGKRKIDPATGKTIPLPSDLNRKKRPTKKLRTAAEKIARNESAGDKRTSKAKHVKVYDSCLMLLICYGQIATAWAARVCGPAAGAGVPGKVGVRGLPGAPAQIIKAIAILVPVLFGAFARGGGGARARAEKFAPQIQTKIVKHRAACGLSIHRLQLIPRPERAWEPGQPELEPGLSVILWVAPKPKISALAALSRASEPRARRGNVCNFCGSPMPGHGHFSTRGRAGRVLTY